MKFYHLLLLTALICLSILAQSQEKDTTPSKGSDKGGDKGSEPTGTPTKKEDTKSKSPSDEESTGSKESSTKTKDDKDATKTDDKTDKSTKDDTDSKTEKSGKDDTDSKKDSSSTKSSSSSGSKQTGSVSAQLQIDEPKWIESAKGGYVPLNKPMKIRWSYVGGKKPIQPPETLTLSIVEDPQGRKAKFDIATDIPGDSNSYIWDLPNYKPSNGDDMIRFKVGGVYVLYLYDSSLNYTTRFFGKKVRNGDRKLTFYEAKSTEDLFSSSPNLLAPSLYGLLGAMGIALF